MTKWDFMSRRPRKKPAAATPVVGRTVKTCMLFDRRRDRLLLGKYADSPVDTRMLAEELYGKPWSQLRETEDLLVVRVDCHITAVAN